MAESKQYAEFEEYVADQPEACRHALHELRRIIHETIPDTEELFNYNIPAFTLIPGGKREQQVMIAGYRKHVGLYPHPTTMEHFDSRLAGYKRGKGSVQFPLDEPLPGSLIGEMLRFRRDLVRSAAEGA
jgi:uncharacterized protein YdhG (YjbR/CyaY superfamily)